jgi:hypothetical protein
VAGLAEGGPVVAAGEVTAARPLDLDDPRAEVSELTSGEGRGHGLLKGDDSEAVEGVSHDRSIMPEQVISVDTGISDRRSGRRGRLTGRFKS